MISQLNKLGLFFILLGFRTEIIAVIKVDSTLRWVGFIITLIGSCLFFYEGSHKEGNTQSK